MSTAQQDTKSTAANDQALPKELKRPESARPPQKWQPIKTPAKPGKIVQKQPALQKAAVQLPNSARALQSARAIRPSATPKTVCSQKSSGSAVKETVPKNQKPEDETGATARDQADSQISPESLGVVSLLSSSFRGVQQVLSGTDAFSMFYAFYD